MLVALVIIGLLINRLRLSRSSAGVISKANRVFEILENKLQDLKKTEKDLSARQKELNRRQKELEKAQKELKKVKE